MAMGVGAQNLVLVNSAPSFHETNVSMDATISLIFSDPLEEGTVNADNIVVKGSHTGLIAGTYSTSNNVVSFSPSSNYFAGETITVTVSKRLSDTTGSFFGFGHTYSFKVSAPVASDLQSMGAKNLIEPEERGTVLKPIGGVPVDIDNDGDIDVIGAALETISLYWFENNGNAGFTKRTIDDDIALSSNTSHIQASDFDRDGDNDILVFSGTELLIYSNGLIGGEVDPQEGPVFTSTAISSGDGGLIEVARIADMDSDGYDDIWYRTSLGGLRESYILFNDGDANFTSPIVFHANGNGGGKNFDAVDLNNDGFLDVLTRSPSPHDKLWIHKNNKDRTFSYVKTLHGFADYEGFSIGDFNGDGFQDFFATGPTDRVVFNNGNFNFSEIPLPGTVNATGVNLIADLNADGLEDLLFQDLGEQTKAYLNDGASNFYFSGTLLRYLRPSNKLFSADLDGDNDLEILGSSTRNSTIFFLQDGVVSNEATLFLRQQGNETMDIELEVRLSKAATEDISFSIIKTAGAAEEGVDFESLSEKEVVIGQGADRVSVTIDVFEDDVIEGSEDVFFSLGNPVPSTVRIIENNLKVDIEDGNALHLVSRSPAYAERQVSEDAPIVLTFNMDVNATTVNAQSIRVFGKYGGGINGSYETVGNTVTFTPDPDRVYFAGERVTVTISKGGLQAVEGELLNKTTMSYFDVATDPFVFYAYGNSRAATTVSGSPRASFPFDYDDDGDIDFFRGMLEGGMETNDNNGAGTFTKTGLYANAGANVRVIETFDFENDGDADFITASRTIASRGATSRFDLLINDGSNNFAFDANNMHAMPLETRKISVYDMNADGYDDLVFSGDNTQNLSFVVAKNIGGVSMELAAFGTGVSPSRTHAILDINHDGLPDILLNEGGKLVGYLNSENYNFTIADDSLLSGTGNGYEYVGVFDFDQDGDEDVAVGKGRTGVGWLVNLGDRWEERIHGNFGFTPYTIEVYDMDGDGNLDFTGVTWERFAVLFANDGAGESYRRVYGNSLGARDLVVADLDGDRRLEPVIVRQKTGIQTSIYFPDRIIANASIVHVEDGLEKAPVTGTPRGVKYALRLTFPNTSDHAVTFDLSDAGTGTATSGVDYLAIAPNTQLTIEPGESEVTFFVEVLSDDDLEQLETVTLTISNSSNADIRITGASATGTIADAGALDLIEIAPAANATITANQSFVFSFDNAVGNASNIIDKINIYGEQSGPMSYDISGLDTRTITLSPTRNFFAGERVYLSVEEYFGNGAATDGLFLQEPYSTEYIVAVTPSNMSDGLQSEVLHTGDLGAGIVLFSDIDDDEDLDVIVFGNRVHYMLNDGFGNYAAAVQLPLDVESLGGLRSGTIFDIDNDGDLDIVTCNDRNLYWLTNPGDMVSAWTRTRIDALSTTSNSTGMRSLQNRDMDGDGFIDVVATFEWGDKVMLYRNDDSDARWRFREQVIGSTTQGNKRFEEIFIGDIDNDGRPDMITSEHRNNVYTYFNEGGNVFTKKLKHANDVTTVSSLIDFDNDGDLDIAYGNHWTDYVRWLRNDGNRNWGSTISIHRTAGRPNYMKALDMDGDGKVNVVSISESNNNTDVFLKNTESGYSKFSLKRTNGGAVVAKHVDVGDIDGDGTMEMVTMSTSYDEILIHRGKLTARLEVIQNGIEGSQDIEVKVNLNNPNTTGAPFTFDVATMVGGSATSGEDFQPFNSQVSIPNGESFATLTITLQDDAIVEPEETLEIKLSNPSNPDIVIVSDSVTASIVSDDLVEANLSTSIEGNEEGPVSLEFTVTLSESLQSDVSFDINDLETGTATRGEDYVGFPNNTSITVLAGEITGTFSVQVLSDNAVEPQETMVLEISNPSIASLVTIGNASAEGNILNFGGSDLEATMSMLTSGEEGLRDIEVAVTLSSPNYSELGPIVFNLEDLSALFGTAVAGEDYVGIGDAQISIPMGAQQSGTYTISINDDELIEIEETVFLNISVDSKPEDIGEIIMASGTVEVGIVDNDQFSVALSASNLEEGETTGMRFTATLDTPNETGAVLSFDLTDTHMGTAISGEDYSALDSTTKIRIPRGSSTGTFILDITNDTDLETDETVELMIANSESTNALITTPTAVGTILNDEVLTATFSRTKNGREEDIDSAQFSVRLNGKNLSGAPIEIPVVDVTGLGSGKAIAGSDYTFSATTITIQDGAESATLSVPILADTRLEGTENFTLQLNPTAIVSVNGNGRATASISDDIRTATGIDASLFFERSVAEGEDLIAVVALSSSNTTGAPITIDIADTSSGTAVAGVDYQLLTQTQVTIPNNETRGSIAVTTLSDALLDGEKELEFQISNPSTAFVDITKDTATGTIIDDTEATAELGVETPILSENGDFIFEVTLSKLNESGSAITFDLVDENRGSARGGIDYLEIPSNAEISIPNGQTKGTYSVSIVHDLQIEYDETIVLDISNPSLESIAITNPTATATITDDDAAAISVSEHELVVAESGAISVFTVVLDVQPQSNVVVNLFVHDASEVEVDVSSLIFTRTNWNMPQTVTVHGMNDDELDGNVVSEITVSVEASVSDYNFRSLASEVIRVTNEDDEVLSVDDVIADDIRCFPNPVEQTLFIESKNLLDNLTIYNSIGQEVLWIDGSTNSIDMSNFETGIYLLKININDATKIIRVVKE
jgi:hypothetical protein